jgi:hypothetical protein
MKTIYKQENKLFFLVMSALILLASILENNL